MAFRVNGRPGSLSRIAGRRPIRPPDHPNLAHASLQESLLPKGHERILERLMAHFRLACLARDISMMLRCKYCYALQKALIFMPEFRHDPGAISSCPGALMRDIGVNQRLSGVSKMKKLVLALAFAGFASASALAAEMDFAKVDADGNGMVSMEEAAAAGHEWTEEQFKAADKDGDGSLNADEFAAAIAG